MKVIKLAAPRGVYAEFMPIVAKEVFKTHLRRGVLHEASRGSGLVVDGHPAVQGEACLQECSVPCVPAYPPSLFSTHRTLHSYKHASPCAARWPLVTSPARMAGLMLRSALNRLVLKTSLAMNGHEFLGCTLAKLVSHRLAAHLPPLENIFWSFNNG